VPDVVVLGSLHLDIMVAAPDRPRTGETLAGTAWSEKYGGKGGNQAVEAARHGARTAMIGAVGDDAFGARLLANLRARGVDATHVAVRPGEGSGMSVAIVDPRGDYGAVIVSGANLSLGPEAVEAAAGAIAGARCLLLQNEVPEAANLAAARLARAGGAIIILNAAPARPLAADWAGLLDLLVVNAVEADMLGGGAVSDLAGAAAAAERLLVHAPSVVVTAGGAGLALARADGSSLTRAAHDVRVASTHGAGDALLGALAARLAAGDTRRDALRYANAAAAALVATPEHERATLTTEAAWRLLASIS
jgi:ribokinase